MSFEELSAAGEGSPVAEMEKPEPPVRFEVVPNELSVVINLIEMNQGEEDFSCWSFVSEGLINGGQKELAIFIKREQGEEPIDYPMDPLGFFLTVRELNSQGQFISDGGILEFGEGGFLDPRFHAIVFIKPIGIAGLEDGNALLSCVMLTEDELKAARQFGLTRVIGLLGHRLSHYPCPPWLDRSRPSVVGAHEIVEMEDSILAKVPQGKVPGMMVTLAGGTITMKCLNAMKPMYKELLTQLPEEAPLCLLTDLDPQANALLVWQAGEATGGPSAITPPGSDGSIVCGGAVVVIPEQEQSNPQVIEDSFLLTLTTSDWIKLRNGLITGTDQSLSIAGGGKIAVQWYDEMFEMPQGLMAAGEIPPLPKVELTDGAGIVSDAQWRSSDEDILRSADPGMICQFVEAVEMTVLGYFIDRAVPDDREVKVVGQLRPNREARWQLSSSPEEDKLELKGIEIRLSDVPIPNVSEPGVSFELTFSLKGRAYRAPSP